MSRLCMIKSIMTPDGVLGTLNEVGPDYDDDDFERMPTLKLNFYPICKRRAVALPASNSFSNWSA